MPATEASVSAMAAAESIVDADFSQGSELAGEIFAVLFFFFMETEVFQKQDFTRFEGISHGFRFCADAVRSEFDVDAEEFRQAFSDRFQGILFDDLSLRAAEMAGQDDSSLVVEQVFDGRQRLLDTRVICDVAVFIKGDVEVSADKDAFVFDIYIGDRFFHERFLLQLKQLYDFFSRTFISDQRARMAGPHDADDGFCLAGATGYGDDVRMIFDFP